MVHERANGSRYDRTALAIGAGCVLVAVAATLVVGVRWRAGREVAPGVPLPSMGRLLATESVPEPQLGPESARDSGVTARPICVHTIEVPGSGAAALDAYEALLAEAGWEPRGADIDAAVPTRSFRSGDRRLTVALLTESASPTSSLRVRLRPCE